MTRNTKVITVATLATLATVATSALGAIIYAVWMMGRHSADPDDWTDDTPPTLNFAAVTVPGVNIDNARWTSPRAIRFPS